jgi:ATP-GRASP peptide maturase of grasp-with-spasm system
MLLILSENNDYSTNEVIDWLNYFKIKYLRVNENSVLYFNYFGYRKNKISWEVIVYEDSCQSVCKICSDDISSFWYRRGYLNMPNAFSFECHNSKDTFLQALSEYLNYNQNDLIELIYKSFVGKKFIGKHQDNFISKILQLETARKVGLRTPETEIVCSKNQLIDFFEQHTKIITKGIKSNGFNLNPFNSVSSLTQIIEKEDLNKFQEKFAPSLIQKYIEKLFELRVFYIDGKCYSAAIFSQNSEETKIDFRNYNQKRPNRVVPYKLPQKIERKVRLLMNILEMKSGSIDIIVSSDLEYYFLEVNPVGQFSWISRNCNYQLEKKIANYFN